MKRDLAILAAVAVVAAIAVVLFVRASDDEPSAVEKVERAMRGFRNVDSASCTHLAARRYRCRVTRKDKRVDTCSTETDSEGSLIKIACKPARTGSGDS